MLSSKTVATASSRNRWRRYATCYARRERVQRPECRSDPPDAAGSGPLNRPGALALVDDPAALARALTLRLIAAGRSALDERRRFDVALAGGSTPKAAYEMLASADFCGDLDWRRVRFFFGDERCVPPDDDRSNYKMAATALGPLLADAGAAIFRMQGEDAPHAAALAYARTLRTELGTAPAFDVLLLGLGADGHTASLFPGTDPYTDDEALVRSPFVEQAGMHRLTITPYVICRARQIVVCVAGSEKAAALAAVLDGSPDPLRYPAAILASCGERVTWLVDRLAAGRLSGIAPA